MPPPGGPRPRRGDRVAATLRKVNALDELKAHYGDNLWVASLDVTDSEAVRRVVDRATDKVMEAWGTGDGVKVPSVGHPCVSDTFMVLLTRVIQLLYRTFVFLRNRQTRMDQGEIMATHSLAKPAGTPTWLDLMAPDIEAARAFYQAVFGWEYDISGPEYGGYTTARLGQRMTAGLMGHQPDAPPMPAAWSLYFATENIEADVAHAVELGANVVSPAMAVGDFGTMATCIDPTGAAFSFWQAGQHVGSQVTEEPGSAAWYELYAPNAKQARDFYMALLGATADLMPGEMEYYVLKHGEHELCGIMQIEPSWGNVAPQWATYFSVANTDETVAVVTEHGGKLLDDVEDSPFGRMATVMDPSGAMFKLIQASTG